MKRFGYRWRALAPGALVVWLAVGGPSGQASRAWAAGHRRRGHPRHVRSGLPRVGGGTAVQRRHVRHVRQFPDMHL